MADGPRTPSADGWSWLTPAFLKRLALVAARYVGEGEEPEDIVQKTFMRLWSQVQKGGALPEPPDHWGYWAAAVRNQAIDTRRQRDARRAREAEYAEGRDRSTSDADAARGVEAEMVWRLVEAAGADWARGEPDGDARTVIEALRRDPDALPREIATSTGLSRRNVYTVLRRIRSRVAAVEAEVRRGE